MDFSVPADLLVLDRTQDGFHDRAYVADIGGTIWRIDTDGATFADWTVNKIATLADRSATAGARKFLFAPDVVFGKTYDAVVIGSGDREHPLAGNVAYGVQNRVYMIKDPNIGTTGAALDVESDDLFDATGSSDVPTDATGWFIDLAPGEKVINGPLVPPGGSLVFGTNQPCASSKLDANGNCDTSGTSTTLSCTGNLGHYFCWTSHGRRSRYVEDDLQRRGGVGQGQVGSSRHLGQRRRGRQVGQYDGGHREDGCQRREGSGLLREEPRLHTRRRSLEDVMPELPGRD